MKGIRLVAAVALAACALPACTGGSHPGSHRYIKRVRIVDRAGNVSIVVERGEVDGRTGTRRMVYSTPRWSAHGSPPLDREHQVILTSEGQYVTVPNQAPPPGAPEIRWEFTRFPEGYAEAFVKAQGLDSNYDDLEKMASKVTRIGKAAVRGVQTRHVRMTIPSEKLADIVSDVFASIPMAPRFLERAPVSFTMDLWLDDADRALRQRYTIARDGERHTYITTSFDWGAAISISLPPDELVVKSSRPAFPGFPS